MRIWGFFIVFLSFVNFGLAQSIPINAWRVHSSYSSGIFTVEAGNKIFVCTANGFYSVDKADMAIQAYSKSDGFSDIFARKMEFSQKHNALFIAYESGNIDLLQNNKVYNIRNLIPSAPINDFYIKDDICYISHKTEVSEYRINKKEFGDSYNPGCNNLATNSVTILDNRIYTSSADGVQTALIGGLLRDCSLWTKINTIACNKLVTFSGKVWGAFADGALRYYDGNSWIQFHNDIDNITSLVVNNDKLVLARNSNIIIISEDLTSRVVESNQQNHAILEGEYNLWLAKDIYSCTRKNILTGKEDYIIPNGPYSSSAYKFHNNNAEMWVAPGGPNEFGGNTFNNSGFYRYTEGEWTNYNGATVPNWIVFKDVTEIRTNPLTGNQWISSLESGLIEFNASEKQVLNYYNASNSSLRNSNPANTNPQVAGLAFDENANLWVANYRAQNQLSVLSKGGEWVSFNLGGKKNVTNLVIDDYNQVWAMLLRENGLYVFNYGETIEAKNDGDEVKDLSTASGNGALPDSRILSLAKDKDGQIWVGSNNGVAVFADPSLMFTEYNSDAQQIWVENGEESGYLLAGQAVTSIAVDGGNRKWFGTKNGAYLTSPDGSEIIQYVNTKNSPLISNDIKDIGINGETGEVFFATDKGIVSYRSTATEGLEKHGDVYAYPNPVKPGYTGPIAIKGLVRDASIKITDITGKLVYETKAVGGQALWNGKNFYGRDANSGVYMVFSTNRDGTETAVTKILIVR